MSNTKFTGLNLDNSNQVELTEAVINNDSIMMRKTLAAICLSYGVTTKVTTNPYNTSKGEPREGITITNADCVELLKKLGVI